MRNVLAVIVGSIAGMAVNIALWATWYNEHRPHQGIGGRAPIEVYQARPAANDQPRFEPRAKWPRKSACARPVVKIEGERGVRLALVVSRFENRTHLPIVELRRAS